MVEQRVPAEVDVEQPSAARVYDYLLGGAHNFEADRAMAQQLLAAYPEVQQIAQANRAFLRRVVLHLVDAGIRQFLDIGSGVPTVGHVHQVAQQADPAARVVLVDVDPVAVAHGREILAGNSGALTIQEDARNPTAILGHPEVRDLLDLEQPVAVLMIALLHYVPEPASHADLIAQYTAQLVPGSYLALSHATADQRDDTATGAKVFARSGIGLATRTRAEVEALFDGWELVAPGVVWVPQWRSDERDGGWDDPAASGVYGAVGRKP